MGVERWAGSPSCIRSWRGPSATLPRARARIARQAEFGWELYAEGHDTSFAAKRLVGAGGKPERDGTAAGADRARALGHSEELRRACRTDHSRGSGDCRACARVANLWCFPSGHYSEFSRGPCARPHLACMASTADRSWSEATLSRTPPAHSPAFVPTPWRQRRALGLEEPAASWGASTEPACWLPQRARQTRWTSWNLRLGLSACA